MSAKTMAEVLEELWDAGNCTGLDGWIGPGRGVIEVDDVALDDRRRDVDKATAALTAAGFGLVADAKAEALEEAAGDFESHVGVGEFAEKSTRDGRYWAHINEAWEHQGPYMDWLRSRAAELRKP